MPSLLPCIYLPLLWSALLYFSFVCLRYYWSALVQLLHAFASPCLYIMSAFCSVNAHIQGLVYPGLV